MIHRVYLCLRMILTKIFLTEGHMKLTISFSFFTMSRGGSTMCATVRSKICYVYAEEGKEREKECKCNFYKIIIKIINHGKKESRQQGANASGEWGT